MKSYTDIKQSKKLAKILPSESADMYYAYDIPYAIPYKNGIGTEEPCWSLTGLLSVLPKEIEIDGQHYAPCLFPVQDKWLLKLWYNSNYTITSPISIFSDNPVDACYEMIIKLHKLNLL